LRDEFVIDEIYVISYMISFGAHDSVVGWGTTLQAEGCRFDSRWSHDFLIDLIFPAALGSTRPPTEMSARNFPRGLEVAGAWSWQLHRHLWADCPEDMRASTSHNPMGLHGLLQGYLYLYMISLRTLNFSYRVIDNDRDSKALLNIQRATLRPKYNRTHPSCSQSPKVTAARHMWINTRSSRSQHL
jgi:hypothetical protein